MGRVRWYFAFPKSWWTSQAIYSHVLLPMWYKNHNVSNVMRTLNVWRRWILG